MSEYIITDEQIAENRRLHGKKLLVMPVIVRCRDCVNYVQSDVGIGDDWCVWWGSVCPSGDGFCAWGDREGERAGTIQSIQPVTTRWEERKENEQS